MLVFEFAQTNLQLRRQLVALGYSEQDVARVDTAYQLGVPLFSAQYRASGKPFIAHLVGTASILASHRAAADTLIAGLLHATFMTGDFGFHPGRRRSHRQRAWLRHHLGAPAEQLVATYDALPWNAAAIATYRQTYPTLDAITREAMRIRLANTYEDFMDDALCLRRGGKALLYRDPGVRESILALTDLADWPTLNRLLRDAFQDLENTWATMLPAENRKGTSALRLPASARRRLMPAAEGWLARRIRRLLAKRTSAPTAQG